MIGDDIEVRVTSVVGDRARIDVAFRSALGEPVRVGMLVPRVSPMRASQSLTIGDDVEVSVLSVIGEKLRIGIQAPRAVPVYRSEVYLEIQREQASMFAAADVALSDPPPLL